MKDGHIKLTDYAVPYGYRDDKYIPVPEYQDPEKFNPNQFQSGVVIWQLGILALLMLTGYHNLEDFQNSDQTISKTALHFISGQYINQDV